MDALFIEKILVRGKEASEKVKTNFGEMSLNQLNWTPTPRSWSIGQCLDHLIVSDCLYFPTLEKITAGKYNMTTWERWSPFNVFFGKMLVNQLQENVKKKVNAPKIFVPVPGSVDAGILRRFYKHLDTLLEYITGCQALNLDKTYITSPVSKIVTYSLRNAITILIQHEHRHINQAIRVKLQTAFPDDQERL